MKLVKFTDVATLKDKMIGAKRYELLTISCPYGRSARDLTGVFAEGFLGAGGNITDLCVCVGSWLKEMAC